MTATIHPFPTKLATLEAVDGLADEIGKIVSIISPNTELAIPALCAVIFQIASNARDPNVRHGAVRALRVVASIVEESSKVSDTPDSPEHIPY